MRTTLIDGQSLGNDQWLVALVLSRHKGHAYIVIEGFRHDGPRVACEAHYGHRPTDFRFAHISLMDVNYERLNSIATSCKMDYWIISAAEKDNLLREIQADRTHYSNNQIPYVKYGASKLAGSVGGSIDFSGSAESKDTSIDTIHRKLDDIRSPSKASIFHTAHATLQLGDNCISWAKKKLKNVLGNRYKEKPLEKLMEMVVVDPQARFRTCVML